MYTDMVCKAPQIYTRKCVFIVLVVQLSEFAFSSHHEDVPAFFICTVSQRVHARANAIIITAETSRKNWRNAPETPLKTTKRRRVQKGRGVEA